jgi:uroporphyrinogen decarboxylase
VPLDAARRRIGPNLAVQGNLDPVLCLAPWAVVADEARDVLSRAGTEPGHVFNLGHGVLPETDPGILEQLVELVHREGRAGVGGDRVGGDRGGGDGGDRP